MTHPPDRTATSAAGQDVTFADQDGVVIGNDGLARPRWASSDELLRNYYDTEWGMPIRDEQGLFERLSLEAFQAGLSWSTVLRKRPAFRAAFDDFQPDAVAAYRSEEVDRLLRDDGIIRNRRKIEATISNARATIELRSAEGLEHLIWAHQSERTPQPRIITHIPTQSPESAALAKALRSRGFSFVGPTTEFALMEAVGIIDTHLINSHRRGTSGIWTCPPQVPLVGAAPSSY